MKMRRRALSVLLSLAVVFTFMPFVSSQAYAASKTKVNIVTKAATDKGNTTYSYNKKGLVKKAVTKYNEKGEGYDSSTVVTTTYKYNKSNRIKQETEKTVDTDTYYDTNKTTGKNNGVKTGTVKTTTTAVTKYTYKKGKAKKSVTTSNTVKSGSYTETEKSRSLYNKGQLTDGRMIAGYNSYGKDGKSIDDNTSANAYYYSGNLEQATYDSVTTHTYRPNADGSYTETTNTAVKNANFVRTPVTTPVTTEWGGTYNYTERVDVALSDYEEDSGDATVENSVVENTYLDKDVTTTNYSYKKGKVSKAVSTTVSSTGKYGDTVTSGASTSSYTYKYKDGSSAIQNYQYNDVDSETYSETTKQTTNYYYKKGRVVKKVVSDAGAVNYTDVKTNGLTNSSYDWTSSNGEKYYSKDIASGPAFASQISTTVANGAKTTSSVYNAYTMTEDNNGVVTTYQVEGKQPETKAGNPIKAAPSKTTTKYAYDKQGNIKSASTSGNSTSIEKVKNETFGNTLVEFGVDGETVNVTTAVSHSFKFTDKFENTIKNGTKRLKKALTIRKGEKYDRSSSSGYGLKGRTSYTIKVKSLTSKNAKAAELQQWIIQNGFNGIAGL